MSKLQRLTFSSLLISISLILSKIEFSLFFPFGGSVTLFSLVPLIIISSKFGYRWGACCGAILGILHLITTNLKFQGFNIFSIIISIFLDYIISYTIIGFFSYFVSKLKKTKYKLYISFIYVFILKFGVHVLSGIIVWSPFFKKNFIQGLVYSVLYNLSYLGPELIINILGLCIFKKLFYNLIKNRED
ncbi:MAG: energy-coupled thiamine transporter ThiT [Oscillospiraceae bacterium]|nr:energy-coupled thiamine transporter ThiT [Oscillospiraceae bacterium]